MGAAAGTFDGEPDPKDIAALMQVLDAEDAPADDEPKKKLPPPPDPDDEEEEPAPAKPAEGEPDDGGEEEAPAAIETVGELARAFEVEPDELLSTLRVDLGEERGGEVTLKHLIDSYSQAPDLAPIHDVAQRYEALAAETQKESRAIFQNTIAAARQLQELIAIDESEIERAKGEGDATRALELVTLNQRRGAALTKAIQAMRDQEAHFGEQNTKSEDAYRAREFQSLVAKMPRWRDEKVGRAAMEQLRKSAVSLGFKSEEIEALTDHRAILAMWKASEYDRIVEKVRGTAKKKVLALPKNLPAAAGLSPTKAEAAKKRGKEKWSRLKRSGDERDAAAVIFDMLE